MSRPTASPDLAAGTEERFPVLVAYEDTSTHERARQLCDNLLNRFWGDLDFDLAWWSFDLLRDGTLERRAVKQATDASLIIVSAHAGPCLPMAVQKWIEQWTVTRLDRGGALAALIGMPWEQSSAPIVNFLRNAAEKARMDFLPHLVDQPESKTIAGKSGAAGKQRRVTATLKKWMDPKRPPSHWGINE